MSTEFIALASVGAVPRPQNAFSLKPSSNLLIPNFGERQLSTISPDQFLALLDYVSRAHEIKICPSFVRGPSRDYLWTICSDFFKILVVCLLGHTKKFFSKFPLPQMSFKWLKKKLPNFLLNRPHIITALDLKKIEFPIFHDFVFFFVNRGPDSLIGRPIYGFLLMFNSNIWPNSAPLQDISFQNPSDFDLSRSLRSNVIASIDSPYTLSY